MKIYINNKMSSIDKIEQEQVFYQGGYLTNKIRILTTEYATDWSPSLHFLLPNGRTIGPVFDSGIAEGDEFSIVENGTVYYAYDFVLSAAVLKVPGILQMTLTINYADDSGNICKRKVIGNFVNTVMKTSIDSDSNVLVVGNNKDEIIQNVIDNLETLNNKLISLMSKGEKGAANGVATLDSKKKIPVEQIPNNVMYSDNDQIITGKKKFNGGIELNDKDLEITLNEMQDEINNYIVQIKDGTIVVGKALNDKDGNDISATYAKRTDLSDLMTKLVTGGVTVSKAMRDEDGNDITLTYVKKNKIGSPNGVAALDGNGKVPSSQLPSYVDDVIEGFIRGSSFFTKEGIIITVPEDGKIYLDIETNKSYRWSGSSYVEIASSIALGETSATAYAGDKGKKNAEDIAEIKETLPTLQPKLTAGNGISISADGTISISLPNGDEVAY